jgi:hypothetical protein
MAWFIYRGAFIIVEGAIVEEGISVVGRNFTRHIAMGSFA